MSDETECKLTFEEGRRIRREAEKPYVHNALLCVMLAFAAMVAFSLYADIAYDVLWKGGKAIEERIVGGDFQAVVDYLHYRDLHTAGPALAIVITVCGAGYAVLGLLAGKKALKEANEEKTERWTRGRSPSR